MHAYLIEIHYVELAMSQRCKITYITLRVKIKDVTKELRKNTRKISAYLSRQLRTLFGYHMPTYYGANIMTKQFEFELCTFELLTSVISQN